MNVTDATSLVPAQVATLKALVTFSTWPIFESRRGQWIGQDPTERLIDLSFPLIIDMTKTTFAQQGSNPTHEHLLTSKGSPY